MKRILSSLSAALALLCASAVMVSAATSTWDGDTDSFWTTALNWDTAPAGGEDIVFPSVANQTVDLVAGTYNIGTLTFNSPNAYSVANGTLTLGGAATQSGAGAVTLGSTTDVGGASRVFNGAGSGVVTFNGPVTDVADTFARAYLNGGNYVIANNANTIDRFEITNSAKVKIVGAGAIPAYPAASYFGGDGVNGGGYYVKLDGGVLDFQATEDGDTPSWGTDPKTTATFAAEWGSRAIIFGPNGGTLIWTNAPAGGGIGVSQGERVGPDVYYSQGGPGTIVVGVPQPYGDTWADPNAFRSPFEVEYGFALGIYQNGSLPYTDPNPYLKWRQGSGDITVIITNGACVTLDWNAMTNGYLIISGQPGGDSSVIETNATGWTRNIGRLAIRGPHRNGVQYSDATLCPVGTITRSFYMDQPYGMVFQNAVQVWNRDGGERLACDMTFEPGSSVDICSGRRTQGLDLGHCGNAATGQAGPTNTMTIKNGAQCNLNLQMRDSVRDGRTAPRGVSAGLRVWSFIDIKDGGQLKIYRSQTNAAGLNEVEAGDTGGSSGRRATKCIELFRPVTGNGSTAADARFVLDLPWSPKSNGSKDSWGSGGNDGVNFEANPSSMGGSWPGPELIVNGSGDYGLRIEGKANYLTNLLTSARLSSVSGSGGTLTIAVTDEGVIDIPNGPSSSSSVSLGIASGSNPKYVLGTDASMANFNGLAHKGGTAVVLDGTSVTMKTLKLAAAAATIQLGDTPGSGAVLNFDNSSGVTWSAGTLSISNWNGSLTGGGPDQIKFGTDATGLTASQLAQVKWISPFGGGDVTGAKILSTGEIVPAVTITVASPALVGGQFVFDVVPAPASPTLTSVIQWATNLAATPIDWVDLVTNTGAFSFTNATTLPESYYRVKAQ